MSERPLVSIVVVSWNVRDLLRACLRSVRQHVQSSYEVIVIDNASTDGTVEMLRQEFSWVQLVANTTNVGFARANNQAMDRVSGSWVCFLNPDTELTEDALTPLITWASQQPRLGIVGPELLNTDRTHQQSVRIFPTLLDQLTILCKMNWLLKSMPWMRRYYADPGARQRSPLRVDQVMGAMMVVSSHVLTEIGWFDPGYPNWFEEVDLCQRVKRHGYDVWYAPLTSIIHHGDSSFGQVLTTKKHRWFLVGLRRYTWKYWPRWQAIIVQIVSVVSYALTVVQLTFKPR